MMKLNEVSTATLEQLADELAAAGWDSTQTRIEDAREAVRNLIGVLRLVCETDGMVLNCERIETDGVVQVRVEDQNGRWGLFGESGERITSGDLDNDEVQEMRDAAESFGFEEDRTKRLDTRLGSQRCRVARLKRLRNRQAT
jgi:hypothetical protein